MMLTKEECENKLKNLKTLQDEIDKICTLNVVANIAFTNAIECFEDLIKEHFKDKKSLEERFKDYKGELAKENPWGDRYADECSKEEINKWILEGYGMPPIREKDDVD